MFADTLMTFISQLTKQQIFYLILLKNILGSQFPEKLIFLWKICDFRSIGNTEVGKINCFLLCILWFRLYFPLFGGQVVCMLYNNELETKENET